MVVGPACCVLFCIVLADQDLILLFSNVVFCWWCRWLVRWWFDGRVGLPVLCLDVWMLENALRKSWSDGDAMVGLDCLHSVWMEKGLAEAAGVRTSGEDWREEKGERKKKQMKRKI